MDYFVVPEEGVWRDDHFTTNFNKICGAVTCTVKVL